MLSLLGQGASARESILNESLSDLQLSPGADIGMGFSEMGAMHNEPFDGSADSAGPRKTRGRM